MANKSTATFAETFRIHGKLENVVKDIETTEILNAIKGIWGTAELTAVQNLLIETDLHPDTYLAHLVNQLNDVGIFGNDGDDEIVRGIRLLPLLRPPETSVDQPELVILPDGMYILYYQMIGDDHSHTPGNNREIKKLVRVKTLDINFYEVCQQMLAKADTKQAIINRWEHILTTLEKTISTDTAKLLDNPILSEATMTAEQISVLEAAKRSVENNR